MYLTIKECSEKSNVSQKTIRRHIYARTLNSEKVSGSYRIKMEDFNTWLKSLSVNKNKIKSSNVFEVNKKSIQPDKYEEININKSWKIDRWPNVMKNGMTFADFFSGAGGLSLGFVMAGYKPVYSVEIMEAAVRTYNSNIAKKFNEEVLDTRDITNSDVKKMAIQKLKDSNVDVIIGGFPCQGFSMSGPRVVDDPRNSLYMHLLDIVKEVKPKVVVMENVTGLRSMLDGKVELKIINDFQKAGYSISVKTLNSSDYGVPQNRKRVIFIGNRINKINTYPKVVTKTKKTVEESISDLLSNKEDKDFNHEMTKHSNEMVQRLLKIPEGKSLYKGYSDAWKKPHWKMPSPTVKENHGGVFVHPKVGRVMTPRELARLQSFPDDFIFKGSKKWQLVQIGNAVPPLLGKAIALSVKKMIKS